MENFLFPVIKVKVIKVIKGFGGNGIIHLYQDKCKHHRLPYPIHAPSRMA